MASQGEAWRSRQQKGKAMTDDRDICERLEDKSIDGAIFLRINAAKEIRVLRHYVARLENDLAIAEDAVEHLRRYSNKQALDIVTRGQEVGRLREVLEEITDAVGSYETAKDKMLAGSRIAGAWHKASAALAEKEEK